MADVETSQSYQDGLEEFELSQIAESDTGGYTPSDDVIRHTPQRRHKRQRIVTELQSRGYHRRNHRRYSRTDPISDFQREVYLTIVREDRSRTDGVPPLGFTYREKKTRVATHPGLASEPSRSNETKDQARYVQRHARRVRKVSLKEWNKEPNVEGPSGPEIDWLFGLVNQVRAGMKNAPPYYRHQEGEIYDR